MLQPWVSVSTSPAFSTSSAWPEVPGWQTVFLGPATSPEHLLAEAARLQAALVGVSYRLTPSTGEQLLGEFAETADHLRASGVRFVFGGTPPVAERGRALPGFFDAIFDGSQTSEDIGLPAR